MGRYGVALYLVVHGPGKSEREDVVHPPTRLEDLARISANPRRSPRWIRAWSPDLHDDRIFSLWEADNAAEIEAMLELYGFLNNLEATPLRVREWGPEDVLAAGG